MNGLRKGEVGARADHYLELFRVTYKGSDEPASCLQAVTGAVNTRLVLQNVYMEVHSGELMAVLGSKDSGKRALLEVIARRARNGVVQGEIQLNGVNITQEIFQDQCGYVPRRVTLIPALTVRQTLHYAAMLTIGHTISHTVKKARIRKVMGELALNQSAGRVVAQLTPSERQRLAIAVELIRDPLLIVLDSPTADLDPLNTYFLVSILANHARTQRRMVVMTIDQPRSDIFPFLSRVTILSLGQVIYSGNTRMMLEYFRNLDFPCPDMENPLMYYLCLSTLDRHTRDHFLKTSQQIESLVAAYHEQGEKYRKALCEEDDPDLRNNTAYPLTSFGPPSCLTVLMAILRRTFSSIFNFNRYAMRELLLRLLLMPLFFTFLVAFHFNLGHFQHSFLSRNGLMLNTLVATSLLSAAITAATFARHRTLYYQESRCGRYGGPLFIFTQIVTSLPISLLTVWASASIIYIGAGLRPEWDRWAMFCGALWAVYVFAEQQTMSLMLLIRNQYTAFLTSTYILLVYIILASGTVRTLLALPQWLNFLSYGIIYRYAGLFFSENEFAGNEQLMNVPSLNMTSGDPVACPFNNVPGRCVFLDGDHYLTLRYDPVDLNIWLNWTLCFVFAGGMWLVNLVAYLVPLPAFIKTKFRD
ncbi:ABCG5 [Cordylochernes scorpioides]|uniref:ABCG5 n=1 Tax=Cordylochernes scorpioides TaxID=51811 RepID=A0ABY6LX99_9ARAC|nr:ABCG5 [Cordylochernes scorpioides]